MRAVRLRRADPVLSMSRATLRVLFAVAALMASDFLGVAGDLDRQTSTDYLGADAPVAFANQPAIEVASGGAPLPGSGPTGTQEGGSTGTSGLEELRVMLDNPETFFAGLGGNESPGDGGVGGDDGGGPSGNLGSGMASIPTGSFGDVAGLLGAGPAGRSGANALGMLASAFGLPSSLLSALGAAAPGAAAALGPAGLGIAGFNGLIALSSALANAQGVPTVSQAVQGMNAASSSPDFGAMGPQATLDTALSAISAAQGQNVNLTADQANALAAFGLNANVFSNPATGAYTNITAKGPTAAGPNFTSGPNQFGTGPRGADDNGPPAVPDGTLGTLADDATTGLGPPGVAPSGEDGSTPGSDTGGAGPW